MPYMVHSLRITAASYGQDRCVYAMAHQTRGLGALNPWCPAPSCGPRTVVSFKQNGRSDCSRRMPGVVTCRYNTPSCSTILCPIAKRANAAFDSSDRSLMSGCRPRLRYQITRCRTSSLFCNSRVSAGDMDGTVPIESLVIAGACS